MKVFIDGIEYSPRAEIPKLGDDALTSAIRQLVSMQYFNETHKLRAQAWDVLNTLAPEIAKLAGDDPSAAYKRMNPDCDSDD